MPPHSKTPLVIMDKVKYADGKAFKKMFSVGTRWLERAVPDINAINVFPVPDGDTGTNMLLTMRSAVEEAGTLNGEPVGTIARSMAYGALMGARGNSGVILSQFWRGFADALEGKDTLDGPGLAQALDKATSTAYGGLVHQVEGTPSLCSVLPRGGRPPRAGGEGTLAVSMRRSRPRVDTVAIAGAAPRPQGGRCTGMPGTGALRLLDGALSSLDGGERIQGKHPDLVWRGHGSRLKTSPATAGEGRPYAFLPNFRLSKGQEPSIPTKISRRLAPKGPRWRDVKRVQGSVHGTCPSAHFKPGEVIRLRIQPGRWSRSRSTTWTFIVRRFHSSCSVRTAPGRTAIMTIASGDGCRRVFNSLGATFVVPGGNDDSSVQTLLQPGPCPSDRVTCSTDNKNIVLTAGEVQKLSEKQVHVVASRTIPQGIAALLAFNYDLGVDDNARAMNDALQTVTTIEIARAVRKSEMDGTKIRKGQFIAIRNDKELVAAGDELSEVVLSSLERVNAGDAELVTLYWGGDIDSAVAETVATAVRERYGIEVELVNGGQPHYDFIISVE